MDLIVHCSINNNVIISYEKGSVSKKYIFNALEISDLSHLDIVQALIWLKTCLSFYSSTIINIFTTYTNGT